MRHRTRIYYTEEQKSQMWDRWQRGESLLKMGDRGDRGHPRSASTSPQGTPIEDSHGFEPP